MANGVPGGLTECQSVLHEGSNPHCDARTGQGGGSVFGSFPFSVFTFPFVTQRYDIPLAECEL